MSNRYQIWTSHNRGGMNLSWSVGDTLTNTEVRVAYTSKDAAAREAAILNGDHGTTEVRFAGHGGAW